MTIEKNEELISHYQSLSADYIQNRMMELEKAGGNSDITLKKSIQDFPVTANVVISILGIGYVTIEVTMTIEGRDIKFHGTGGGVIVGAGGISFVAGVSGFSRSHLEGKTMNFNLNLAPTGITIVIDQQILGPKVALTGPGLNVGGGVATGQGKWD